jgi:hypothetical protein
MKTDLRGADAVVLRILALQSGEPSRVRRALGDLDQIPSALIPHLIPLLATTSTAPDAMRALRAVAARHTGMLIDALLDRRLSPVVRRRVARVMSACRSRSAVEGLLEGCEDDDCSVRRQCARTLFLVHRQSPEISLDVDHVFSVIDREIESGSPDAGLLFTLLALVFPPAAIRVAYRSLRGSNRHARGFALEYMNGVLPERIREKLAPVVAGLGGDDTSR